MKRVVSCLIALMSLGIFSALFAQVPQLINYQGRVSVNATNFDGTGQFMFALVDGTGATTYWSNGVGAVSLPVTAGLYSALLGDTSIPNMAAIPAPVFTNTDVRLRVWFDGGVGLEQLTPDQRLTAVGYALMAGNVSDGSITSPKLAAGAITTLAIADGAVGTSQLANNSVTSAIIASNTITAANIAPGAGLVPPGTIVLSQTASNDALTAAGFAPMLTNIVPSSVGSNWLQATPAAPWSGRNGLGSIVFNGQMWVLGGNGSAIYNDVWSSLDGTNWTLVTSSAPWSPRTAHGALVFNKKMWVLGGANTNSFNDVWSSSDGTNWTRATASAQWTPRRSQASVASGGQMWVLAGDNGTEMNDVWYSADGASWTRATAGAPWIGRYNATAMAFNGRIWVLGGYSRSNGYLHDVWSSLSATSTTTVTLGQYYLYQKQ